MTKNIIIFSDGTGQRGGQSFEENRTNIYKLYLATKCGPDSCVDPTKQFAFYDPGIGTTRDSLGFLGTAFNQIYNMVCQATGLGLTRNIKDCYAAILRNFEPGDRIYLFGFSRGAYTVRCLASVLALCGLPATCVDGSPLRKDQKTLIKIASEAVENVYQHVSSPKDEAYFDQRKLLATRFREEYSSLDAFPHFIGVFDTVASVANYVSLAIAAAATLFVLAILAIPIAFFLGHYWTIFCSLCGLTAFAAIVFYLKTHFKVAFGLPGIPWWKTLHHTAIHMRFYDQILNTKVGFARHALAIDEHRKDFDRVPWANKDERRATAPDEPDWLKQIWFSGCHADIGGGYAEPESRLSDAALAWMVEEIKAIPDTLILDPSVLQTYPSPDGMQHDETKSLIFRFDGTIDRQIPHNAILHPTVLARFALTNPSYSSGCRIWLADVA